MPAYVNNSNETTDQLVLVDNSAQIFEPWEFHHLINFARDVLAILPHLLDLHLVNDLFAMGKYERLSADQKSLDVISDRPEVE